MKKQGLNNEIIQRDKMLDLLNSNLHQMKNKITLVGLKWSKMRFWVCRVKNTRTQKNPSYMSPHMPNYFIVAYL